MRLQDRDLLLFKMLDKFRILNAELICYYCNFPSYVSVIRRLRLLYQNGYINRYREDIYSEYIYYLTQKGINVIVEPRLSKSGRTFYKSPSKFLKSNVSHELIVANTVKYILNQNNDITIDDIELDREIRSKVWKKTKHLHIPDVRIQKYNFVAELELSRKEPDKLYKNIADNHFYFQLWIVPQGKKKMIERIEKQALVEINTSIAVTTLENLETFSFVLKSFQSKLFEENSELQDMIAKAKEREKQLNLTLD